MDGAAAEQHSQAVPSLMNGGGSQEGPEAAHRVQAVKGAQEDGKPGADPNPHPGPGQQPGERHGPAPPRKKL